MYNNRILHIGNIHKLVEGLLPVAELNKKGLLDSNILSSIISAGQNSKQQYTIIKVSNVDSYCSAIIALYHGGKCGLYSITTISNKNYYIRNLSSASVNDTFFFYKNDNSDLIFHPIEETASNRIRLLMLDYAGIDFSKCLTHNEEDTSSMERLTIY